MLRLTTITIFRIFFFLFFAPAITIKAQETNFYKHLLKEPLKPDFMKPSLPLEMDSIVILEIDSSMNDIDISELINEVSMRRVLFQHRIEFLLPEDKIVHLADTIPKLSPYATIFSYTNPKNKLWNNGKFNGDGSFSGEFMTKKDILESKAARVMVNVPGLVLFIFSKVVKTPSINNSSSKESKALKKAKSIKKDVYHIED